MLCRVSWSSSIKNSSCYHQLSIESCWCWNLHFAWIFWWHLIFNRHSCRKHHNLLIQDHWCLHQDFLHVFLHVVLAGCLNILSHSSTMKNLSFLRSNLPLLIRSFTLPGVPTIPAGRCCCSFFILVNRHTFSAFYVLNVGIIEGYGINRWSQTH